MVGDIGQIKREIVFSGDVLNTASRIQLFCNETGAAVLVSKEFEDLQTKLPPQGTRIDLGQEKLGGKTEQMTLATYQQTAKH
jgi:adenylate cyclase